MSKELKNVASVSLTTILSRITGLFRDILIFAALGVSIWSSAFILGFTIPNLFRRLFGEGALSSAFIPTFATVLEKSGIQSAYKFFNRFCIKWAFYLSLTMLFMVVVSNALMSLGAIPSRWTEAVKIFNFLLPYMVFICLAAIANGALNVLDRFFAAAVSPIIFNISIILCLGIGIALEAKPEVLIFWICIGVLIGGLLQLIIPLLDLNKHGWTPRWLLKIEEQKPEWSAFWALFIPSIMGAAVLQVNVLVSRLLAYSLDDSAVSLLYIASRLTELPLGVFTIAIVTVFFPAMARSFAGESAESFQAIFMKGMRFIILFVAPASLGLCLLAEPILVSIFVWGLVDYSNVQTAVPVLILFALALPFYSIATFSIRCFHAQKDMKTPVKFSLYTLIINTILSLILMNAMGVYGLALANLISAIFFTLLLCGAINKKYSISIFDGLFRIFTPIAGGLILIVAICLMGKFALAQFELSSKGTSLLTVALLIPSSAGTYFMVLSFLGVDDLAILKKPFIKNSIKP